jgi:hypothetical protein
MLLYTITLAPDQAVFVCCLPCNNVPCRDALEGEYNAISIQEVKKRYGWNGTLGVG